MSRLRANQITNKTANGAPTATNGFIVTGIVTATSYRGDGSQLTGISVGITTEAITPSGITTHLLLSSADDHKVLATGVAFAVCFISVSYIPFA